MANLKQLSAQALELMKQGAVIITAAEIEKGIMQRVQVYFGDIDEGNAAMDIINKDDLVQNFPEEGVYVLNCKKGLNAQESFSKVTMFEGAEDMYFRIDGTLEEADDFGSLPSVLFMETVEAFCSLEIK
jgi:hypothetical protein